MNPSAESGARAMLVPNFETMPPELAAQPRWLVWRGAKVPYCAAALNQKASSTDPDTWCSFSQARTAFEEGGYLGVGFVLNNDGIVGVDLDKCVSDGQPSLAALAILDRLGCQYIELSPSGTGLRSFGYAEPLSSGRRGVIDGICVELYSTGRYLTVTGNTKQSGPLVTFDGFAELAAEVARGESARYRREQKSTEDDICNLQCSSVEDVPICNFLPMAEGQRNASLFQLARYLRGAKPNATKDERRVIVKAWHTMALPVIGTSDFSVTWCDFERGYEKVTTPYGATLSGILSEIDSSQDLPESIKGLGYGETCHQLIRICRQLQIKEGEGPFFISARVAGEILGVHFTSAAKMLSTLVLDEVLELVSQGVGKVASRYRYLWPG